MSSGEGRRREGSEHRHRRSPGSGRASSPGDNWRNVRIKEEPSSDVEGGGRRGGGGDRDRRRDESRSGRSARSRSRERDRRDRGRETSSRSSRDPEYDRRRVKEEPSSRSRSPPDRRRVKEEPRNGSRSPPAPTRDNFARPADRGRDSRHRGSRGDDRGGHGRHEGTSRDRESGGDSRPREPKRERDWNNFFNPESEMSQQAVALRDKADAERQERIAEEEKDGDGEKKDKNLEKEKPNFGLSGKLTEETNTYRGVVIKYSEPVEARKPIRTRWRLYPFKDGEALDVMYIHRQSAYLLGRERKIADIPIDHPSCSKQHAALQYRLVPYQRPDGSKGRRIRPYIIDLESSNGTYVNGERIEAKRYVELFEKDVLKFGFSSREYVLLHEHSKDDDPDIDDEFGAERSPSPD